MRTRRTVILIAFAAVTVLAAGDPSKATANVPSIENSATTLTVSANGRKVVVDKAPWRLRVTDAAGTTLAKEAATTPVESIPNPDSAPFDEPLGMGIDLAYPGLPSVSYQPLAFLRAGAWQHVTTLVSHSVVGDEVAVVAQASDGSLADVTLAIEDDGAVRVGFRPRADSVEAVAEAFDAPAGERYVGGGQRFGAFDQRGRSVPLWISHGVGSDRFGSTNEIAVPFLLSTGGWALGLDSGARGEMNIGVASERPDALNTVIEDDSLSYRIYTGSPQGMLSAYTARAGRPEAPPPVWAFRPAYWMDEGNTQVAIEDYVERLRSENIAAGAFWIDNPWETHKGDFAPDPKRFPDFDGMVSRLHAGGVRVVTWASPFVEPESRIGPQITGGGHLVEGTGENDATYLPPRGLDPHLDLTDPAGVDTWTRAAEDLLRRGVDGFKADRGEEDLGEGSRWANGRPNRLNHNGYVTSYHRALREACKQAGKPDCFVIARGGSAGTQRYSTAWAGDNLSGPGATGLGQALRSLLSLSVSGQPVSGSDIGGYTGTRSDAGDGFPTKDLFIRWTQLGALSPIMQTLYAPWEFDAETVQIFRRYAAFHALLAPSLERWSREASQTGVPIVRPLLLAFPGDPIAVRTDDQYLLGPDLLVAPLTEAGSGPETRPVYVPAGRWRDVWTGEVVEGPRNLVVTSPLDRLPLYARVGGQVPDDALRALRGEATQRPAGSPGPADASRCRDVRRPRIALHTPRRRARRPLVLRGRARDRGCRDATGIRRSKLARVSVAVTRLGNNRCRPVGRRWRLGRARRCGRPRFVRARGLRHWSRRLPGGLPRGVYGVRVRAVDRAGNAAGARRRMRVRN